VAEKKQTSPIDVIENPDFRQVGDNIWVFPGLSNSGLVVTNEGLVLIDVPIARLIKPYLENIRKKFDGPVRTVLLTHGHADHSFSLEPLFEMARKDGQPRPTVVGHRDMVRRFGKYRMLAAYQDHINRIQFAVPEGVPAFVPPRHNPDVTFDQSLSLVVGGVDFHACHAMGETDDASWIWIPEKKIAFSGDLVISGLPNVGNPFKVQRFTLEWAEGVEAILAREPEVLVPGHGPVIKGRENIRNNLLMISRALRYLHDEVVRRLNDGMWYEDILHDVELPDDLKKAEAIAPNYGHPAFIVHGVLRQYTGWYDGNPANLFPPKKAEVAMEIASVAGKEAIMARAGQLQSEGRESMALQFVDIALAAGLGPEEARRMHRLKGELLNALGEKESSLIARNIFFNGRDKEYQLAGDDR